MPVDVTIDRVSPSCAVAAIHGELILSKPLRAVEKKLEKLMEDGVRGLVLDLTDCGYSDSAGLGFLVYTYGLISQKGGALRLCGVPQRMVESFVTTRTDGILPCDATRDVSLGKLSCGAA
jgi:anti-anti-sigma factor